MTSPAAAGEQVQLNVISTSGGDVAFDLTGPGGYTAFTDLRRPTPARSRCHPAAATS